MYVVIAYVLLYVGAIYVSGTYPAVSILFLTGIITHILFSFVFYVLKSIDKEFKYREHILELYDLIYSEDSHFQNNAKFYRQQIILLKELAAKDHQDDLVIKCNKLLAKI